MTRTLCPNASLFVSRVETLLREAGYDGGLEELVCRILTGPDLKAGAFVWATVVSYKYGLPAQTVEHALTEDDLHRVWETVQQLLSDDEEAREVGKPENVKAKDVVN